MDKSGSCNTNNSRSTVRTDLSLLLECLKFQMKSPDLQKQALLTIHSICEKREDNVDLLSEMGGVMFMYNLSKSSIVHSDVKETALFTLATLAEANVYCKNSLCRKEIFADLAGCLIKEDIPPTRKTVSVYLLSVLVANNKSGQTLAQTTGCLGILLDLFATTFPISADSALSIVNATQTHKLWTSISIALCGCVNNPQNVDSQRLCVAAFPKIKTWLQQITLPCEEIFQPICSFIAMTVANNTCVQESFSACGGLDTLTFVLVSQASAADTSVLSCRLSVTISKTLAACISDNPVLASSLAQYGVVSYLISLLACPNLDPEDRLAVLLTLGHCTGATEVHQAQLVQCGGLPIIITLLTEDTSDEVRKAATFILQTCKQATMSLGPPSFLVKHGDNVEPDSKLESFKSSAKDLLHRIDLLEKRQIEETKDKWEDTDPAEMLNQPSVSQAMNLHLHHLEAIPTINKQNSFPKHEEAGGDSNIKLVEGEVKNDNTSYMKNMSSYLNAWEENIKTRAGEVCHPLCRGNGIPVSSQTESLEGGREQHVSNSNSVLEKSKCTDGVDLQGHKKSIADEHSFSPKRCAGCVLPFEKVTSRTFASLQNSNRNSCEMHKVIYEATEKYRSLSSLDFRRVNQKNSLKQMEPNDEVLPEEPQKCCKPWKVKEVCLAPICKAVGKNNSCMQKHHWKMYNGITLTPLRKEAKKKQCNSINKTSQQLAPLERQHLPGEAEEEGFQ